MFRHGILKSRPALVSFWRSRDVLGPPSKPGKEEIKQSSHSHAWWTKILYNLVSMPFDWPEKAPFFRGRKKQVGDFKGPKGLGFPCFHQRNFVAHPRTFIKKQTQTCTCSTLGRSPNLTPEHEICLTQQITSLRVMGITMTCQNSHVGHHRRCVFQPVAQVLQRKV